MKNVENLLVKFDSIIQSDVVLTVRSTASHAIHLQFDISANALDINAVLSPKCIVWCAVDCTLKRIFYWARRTMSAFKIFRNTLSVTLFAIWLSFFCNGEYMGVVYDKWVCWVSKRYSRSPQEIILHSLVIELAFLLTL
jgi:hypothetical protein